MSFDKVLLLSNRDEDLTFVQELIAKLDPIPDLLLVPSWNALIPILAEGGNPLVFWDLDSPDAENADHPYHIDSILKIVKGQVPSAHMVLLTTKPLNSYKKFLSENEELASCSDHNLIRRFRHGIDELYMLLLKKIVSPEPLGLVSYFSEEVKIQKIVLKRSSQKNLATKALENTLKKIGFDSRLAARVAQATDELLMNGVFDAPRDRKGVPTRQLLERKLEFDLSDAELVELELGFTKNYFGICVTDKFGSFTRDVLFRFLNQNYQDSDYQVRKYGPGAGLGLYGIVTSGLSLIVNVKPGKRTDALIFFPRSKSFKDFRMSFQFSSYITTDDPNSATKKKLKNRLSGF